MTVSGATLRALRSVATREEGARAVAERCEQLGVAIVGTRDDAFPPALRSIPHPPEVLFALGDLCLAHRSKAVAVVGTRTPTPWGRRAAAAVTDRFAEAGWIVVSGLAPGIDAIAHEQALLHGAPTIAVVAEGVLPTESLEDADLADRIVAFGGLLLSEHPPGTAATLHTRTLRDRLQSGLAELTVVCQAERSSGAVHTARFAVEQGRPLYVAAPARDEPQGWLDEGTQALLTAAAAELPALLPAWASVDAWIVDRSRPPANPLDEERLEEITARGLSVRVEASAAPGEGGDPGSGCDEPPTEPEHQLR